MSEKPKIPNLSVTLRPAQDSEFCEGTPEKVSIKKSDVLVRFGEVKITQTITLGYHDFLNPALMGKPKWKLYAQRVNKKPITFEYKYDHPKYLAGSLVQLHDYHASAGQKIVKDPPTTNRDVVIGKDGQTKEVKVFNEPAWQHFGETNGQDFDFGRIEYGWEDSPMNDFDTYNVLEVNKRNLSLRQHYLVEAHELITRLKSQEKTFEKHISNKKLEYLDLTNEMRTLYAAAAAGQLPYDPVIKRYRISNEAVPGFEREISIVFTLYFLTVRAELCSKTGGIFDEIELGNKPGFQALENHEQKKCLKALIVLNEQDTEKNEGIFFFSFAYNRGNPDASFFLTTTQNLPAHGIDSGIAPSSGIAVDFKDSIKMSPSRFGSDDGRFLTNAKLHGDWVILQDGLEGIWSDKMITRAEYLRFWRIESERAESWAMGAVIGGQRYIYQPFKRGQSFGVKMVPASIKDKGPLGIEVLPGCKFWLTAGQNITNGDIPNMTLQTLFVLPFESFAVLTDTEQYGPTTLQTLPGKFWNMFSMGIFHIKLDMIKVINEGARIVNYQLNILPKQKEAIRKMKEYVESMRAKLYQHVEELNKALQAKDLAKYNEILDSLKSLAAEWAQRIGPNQDLTESLDKATVVGGQLKIYTDAMNQLRNMPLPPGFIMTPNGPVLDPNYVLPKAPPLVSYEETQGTSVLIPKDGSINPITNQKIDPIILQPGGDTASGSSQGSLGNINNFGNLGNSQDIPGSFQNGNNYSLPILDATHPGGEFYWYDPNQY